MLFMTCLGFGKYMQIKNKNNENIDIFLFGRSHFQTPKSKIKLNNIATIIVNQNQMMSEDMLRKKLEKKQENMNIRNYKSTIRTHLLTSRFNAETIEQNAKYRNNKWQNGCLYCTPEKISQKIPLDSKLIVLEMNNDANQIFGVGMLTNKPFFNKHSVYNDENYNRYSYIGKYRIKREELTETEEAVFKALDILCFKGNKHMKRGHGLKAFPITLLMNCSETFEITPFIENMFKMRFSK